VQIRIAPTACESCKFQRRAGQINRSIYGCSDTKIQAVVPDQATTGPLTANSRNVAMALSERSELVLLRARGCASSTTLQVNFNFSSTYSESSIMRSANCSAGSPAKFLSTNSFT